MLLRRTTAQRDRDYARDNVGELGPRHQPVMLRKDGKLWPSVAKGWVAEHRQTPDGAYRAGLDAQKAL